MFRFLDVLHFLRQIFFPNWTKQDAEPTGLRKIFVILALFFASKNGTGTIFSIVLHLFVLTVLALIMIPQMGNLAGIDILGGFNIPSKEPEPAVIAPPQEKEQKEPQQQEEQNPTENLTEQNEKPETVTPSEQRNESVSVPVVNPDQPGTEPNEGKTTGGFVAGGGFQHRTPTGRQRAVQSGDCSRNGENAVEAALEWLAAHQQPDGGWSLSFDDSCKQCSHSGTGKSNRRTAATALALLPFLGAGYTYQTESRYKNLVEKGLLFLIRDPNGGIDGAAINQDELRMYSHGLASIALCEAYTMSKEQQPESAIGKAAQRALLTIETAQDAAGGGWRYRPMQNPGDTSVFAWQLMALKSGKLGGLHVSQSVLYAAQEFLDSVALEGGRKYQYMPTGGWDIIRGDDSPKTCTAIGLLMRMYLGWKPGDLFLDDGMATLAQWGYAPGERKGGGECNLYYAYYATLAMHHYGGEHWTAWNNGVRELLIREQSKSGHEAGSWFFRDPYCDSGGRLLNTALGAMILETPYRIMPLYRKH